VSIPEGSDILDTAKRALEKARDHEENSFPGKPEADRENRLAIEAYERAIALYEEAQRQHPEKAAEIEQILESMYASLFWCKKRQTLD
jgi:hypothetical protein